MLFRSIVVLHNGKVVRTGLASDIVAQTGAANMAGAFSALTASDTREAAA